MSRPASTTEQVAPATTRVLLALIADYSRHGRSTVRSVAYEARRSVGNTHRCLTELRNLGLVDWTRGQDGTLRPMVQPQTLNPTSRP